MGEIANGYLAMNKLGIFNQPAYTGGRKEVFHATRQKEGR
jgi:hypothetical protein